MAAKHDLNIETINEMFESGFRIQPDCAGFELIDRVFALHKDYPLAHDTNQAICSIVQHNQDVIAAHPKFVSLLHDVLRISSNSSSVPLAMALISLAPDIECLYSFDHRKIELTPLQNAVLHYSHVNVIKALLSRGADPNRMCPTGSTSTDTLLTLSINRINRDRLAVVFAFLDHDSDPNIVSPARGMYPLFICLKLLSVRNDESMITTIVKCLDILLKAGAKVNQPIKSYLERAPICANPGKYYKIIGVCGLVTFQPAYDIGKYCIRENLSIIELLVDAGTIPHEVEHMSRSLLDQYKDCLFYPEVCNITGPSKYFDCCVMKLLEAGFDLYFHGNTVTSLRRGAVTSFASRYHGRRDVITPPDMTPYINIVSLINASHQQPKTLFKLALVCIRAWVSISDSVCHLKIALRTLPLPAPLIARLCLEHLPSVMDVQ